MSKSIIATGAETTDKIEFQTSGPNASNSNLNPKTGSRNFELDYNLVADVISCQLAWTSLPAYFNWALQGHFKLAGTPLADVTLCIDTTGDEDDVLFTSDVKLELTTARTLKLTSLSSATGSTVLTVGQYYQIEIRADRTCNERIYLRINEVDEVDVGAKNPTLSKTSFGIGEKNKSTPQTDPQVVVYVDDIVFWSSTSSGVDELPPWLNTQSCDYRNVDGNGTHADFLGSDGNKIDNYLQVDEHSPHDVDATYNESGGVADALEKDSYAAQDRVIADTINGFTVYLINRASYTTDSEIGTGGTFKLIVRDNGVDFETDFPFSVLTTYSSQRVGYVDRPNGGADLTDPIMDALEIGLSSLFDLHTDLALYFAPALSGLPDNASLEPTVDSAVEDGLWSDTTTLGGPWDAWEIIDNDISDSYIKDQDGDGDFDYLFTSIAGDKQGFKVPADTVGARIITGVTIRGYTAGSPATVGGTVRLYFKDSVGVFHFSPAIDVSSGSIEIKHTFSINPEASDTWAMGEITGGEWGIEATTIDSGKEARLYAFNVCVNYRSKMRITSAFIVTAHGDAIEEFTCPVAVAKEKGFNKFHNRIFNRAFN